MTDIKVTEITIVFSSPYWCEFGSFKKIGKTSDELVKFVNDKKLRVKNEDCFRYKNDFWYNK